jgi:RNA polymerase sigma-70 factor (ECF subfamily)
VPPDHDAVDDAELIRLSAADPERFAALFDRYAVQIHHYAARRLGTQAADDIVAETFLIAFRRRGTYDLDRPLARPWLYGIATTLIARHRRDEQRHYRALRRTGVDPLPEPVADTVATSGTASCPGRWPGSRAATATYCSWSPGPISRTTRSPKPWTSPPGRSPPG